MTAPAAVERTDADRGVIIFFIFVVTIVLSSVTFLLGLLRGNGDPLFITSVLVDVDR